MHAINVVMVCQLFAESEWKTRTVQRIIDSLSHHRGKVIIEENVKLWAHARILNRYVVAGHRVCVELFVRNHTSKKVSQLGIYNYVHKSDLVKMQDE